jgi:uncharacterized protein (DUF2147 family)
MRILHHIGARQSGLALALTALAINPAAAASTDPTGVWLDDKGRGAIEITACGNRLCGHVVWVKDEADSAKGCGRKMIGDVAPVGAGRWGGGWIYSPERRKTFDVELRPRDDGTLQVTGYAGTKLFSRTMIWTPAPTGLVRCGETEVNAEPSNPAPTPPASSHEQSTGLTGAATPNSGTPNVDAPAPGAANAGSDPSSSISRAAEADDRRIAVQSETAATSVGGEDMASATESGDRPAPKADRPRLGGIALDQILTRSGAGKCKLDLPWVKVQFDCDR